MAKVHYRYYGAGRIACNPYIDAGTLQNLTSVRNPDKVTCGNCRRIILKERER